MHRFRPLLFVGARRDFLVNLIHEMNLRKSKCIIVNALVIEGAETFQSADYVATPASGASGFLQKLGRAPRTLHNFDFGFESCFFTTAFGVILASFG